MARHPLVPLTVIGAIIVFLAIRTEQARLQDPVKMRILPVGKNFDDPAAAFLALQLMDVKRHDEAARALLGLSMPPIRLSSLLTDVRRGDKQARHRLNVMIDNWLLKQEGAAGNDAFPSQDTPTLVLNFVADVAEYRTTKPFITSSFEDEIRLGAIFKRASVEKQLRALDHPTRKQAASVGDASRDGGYQPPVEAP